MNRSVFLKGIDETMCPIFTKKFLLETVVWERNPVYCPETCFIMDCTGELSEVESVFSKFKEKERPAEDCQVLPDVTICGYRIFTIYRR